MKYFWFFFDYSVHNLIIINVENARGDSKKITIPSIWWVLRGSWYNVYQIFPSSEIELNHWQGLIEKRELNMKSGKIQELFAKIGIMRIWYMIGLPVTIRKGMIGLLSVKIPWT